MIDLHMHTIHSDGSYSVKEILEMCEKKKLEFISITDHNTANAYEDEEFKNNNSFTGTIIKGCEVNAEFQKKSIEILGYNINPSIMDNFLQRYFSKQKTLENKKLIGERFLKILDKKGIIYNINNIDLENSGNKLSERVVWEEIIKYAENRRILGDEYFEHLRVFFRKELTNPNSEYFVNRVSTFPAAKVVIDAIHIAGGKAFLAHPFEYKLENTIKFIDDLKNETSLDGIEAYHPSAEEGNNIRVLVDYANKNNLFISGGSDYHGELKPEIDLGVGKGSLKIEKEILKWI